MRGLSQDYPEFPEIKDTLGYNPARFLDRPLGNNGQTAELSAKGLIRGIQEVEHLRLWIAVEEALGRGQNGGPRQEVMKWIGHRQVHLQEHAATHEDTNAHEPSPETAGDSAGSDTSRGAVERVEEPTATDTADLVENPRCPTCGNTLKEEHIAGQRGFWCLDCRAFREPASAPPSPSIPTLNADANEVNSQQAMADGGAPDPATPHRCPDCHGELSEETVGDEDDAHWCSYCGQVVRVGVAV